MTTRANRGRRYPIDRSHATLEAKYLTTDVIQLRADSNIRRCREETVKAVSAYQKRNDPSLGCPTGWRQIAFQHIHSAGIADQYATIWRELLDIRKASDQKLMKLGREWAELHGGINGRCGTNPEDVPNLLMTEHDFWRDHSNRNSN